MLSTTGADGGDAMDFDNSVEAPAQPLTVDCRVETKLPARAARWMFYLNILSFDRGPEEWLEVLEQKRQAYIMYADLKRPKLTGDGESASLEKPTDNVLLSEIYAIFEAEKQERSDMPFHSYELEEEDFQRMQECLYVYCSLYGQSRHLPAMTKLLLLIARSLLVARREFMQASNTVPACTDLETALSALGVHPQHVYTLIEDRYFEHDCFLLFEALMERLQPWYRGRLERTIIDEIMASDEEMARHFQDVHHELEESISTMGQTLFADYVSAAQSVTLLDNLLSEVPAQPRRSGITLLKFMCRVLLEEKKEDMIKAGITSQPERIIAALKNLDLRGNNLSRFLEKARTYREVYNDESNEDRVTVNRFDEGTIGLVVTQTSKGMLVVSGFNPKGQALACGNIQAGDIILSINGKNLLGVGASEFISIARKVVRPLFIAFKRVSPDRSLQNELSPKLLIEGETEIASIFAISVNRDVSPDENELTMMPGYLRVTNYRIIFDVAAMEDDSLRRNGGALSPTKRAALNNFRRSSVLQDRLSLPETNTVVSVHDLKNLSADRVDKVLWSSPIACLHKVKSSIDITSRPERVYAISTPVQSLPVGSGHQVALCLKNSQVKRFTFPVVVREIIRFLEALLLLAYGGSSRVYFAFSHFAASSRQLSERDRMISSFEIDAEYTRLGLCGPKWRLANQNYAICSTYPSRVVVPSEVGDDQLKVVAAFRSRARFPATVWRHPESGVTISRSSQPLTGIRRVRCREDEQFLSHLAASGDTEIDKHTLRKFYIVDARSRTASVGNRAMGKGSERTEHYAGAEKAYMNIGNIHAVRDSARLLFKLWDPNRDTNQFVQKLDDSGWLKHVQKILAASVHVVRMIELEKVSCLIHCSDGWDRTAQIVATAELLLDPFYRTFDGFQVLIKKEWCAFGHQFARRCGHGREPDDQQSPIFLLWLDVVWQICQQYPNAMEFSPGLLVALIDLSYSCRFGTFLFDYEAEREHNQVYRNSLSVWEYIGKNKSHFLNKSYQPCGLALYPSTASKNIKLWIDFYARYDPTTIGKTIYPTYM